MGAARELLCLRGYVPLEYKGVYNSSLGVQQVRKKTTIGPSKGVSIMLIQGDVK